MVQLIPQKMQIILNIESLMGRGCGAVGRAVASDARDPRFESRHRQYFMRKIYLPIAIEKRRK